MISWLRILPFGGVALISAILTWQVAGFIHSSEISRLNRTHAEGLVKAVSAEREICTKNQKTTNEVSDAYQKKIRDINVRHADAVHRLLQHEADKRVQPADAASGHDAAAGGDGFPVADAAGALFALELAATAERQAQQLTACQDYVNRVTR